MSFPKEFTQAIEQVRQNARNKYGSNDWEDCPEIVSKKSNYESMTRHLNKHMFGNNRDEESNLYHMAHLAYRALMEYTRLVRQEESKNE